MRAIGTNSDPFAGDWGEAPSGWMATFIPATGDALWLEMPLITDLFPWQQPGCKFGRTWPISPSRAALRQRWARLTSSNAEERPGLFVTATSGRTITTKVAGLTKLADVQSGEASRTIARYSYRSFDRQWTFDDPRIANLERPSLWQCQSDRQLFLSSLLTGKISEGPALAASTGVPDLHLFRGNSGGKDTIPLWRDAAASQPNMTAGLGRTLGTLLGRPAPAVEELAAYCYALLSATAYQARFAVELETPGLRVPITADGDLWQEAVAAGEYLLWLHTYAERFGQPAANRGVEVPDVGGIEWLSPVGQLPATMSEIGFEADTGVLTVGDGRVGGVRPDVWAYSVSGMAVIPKWLGYRTARGAGRATSSSSGLDRIRPTTWEDEWNDELLDLLRVLTVTLDRQAALADLLARICDGPLIPASSLPVPTAGEREPPATIQRF